MDCIARFKKINSYDDFIKHYWYKKDLVAICRYLNSDSSGTKQDLNAHIQEYFKGNQVKQLKVSKSSKRVAVLTLTPSTSLLDCEFAFNQRFRDYFSTQTGIKPFKFTADMAAAWRQVKKEENQDFTLQDMLDVYYQKPNTIRYDHAACEWNQFVKDFCADKKSQQFSNRLKVAAVLWGIVKNSTQDKIYRTELVERYFSLLEPYVNHKML